MLRKPRTLNPVVGLVAAGLVGAVYAQSCFFPHSKLCLYADTQVGDHDYNCSGTIRNIPYFAKTDWWMPDTIDTTGFPISGATGRVSTISKPCCGTMYYNDCFAVHQEQSNWCSDYPSYQYSAPNPAANSCST